MKVQLRPSFALSLAVLLAAFSARAQVAIFAEGAPMPPPADAAQQRAKAQHQVEQGEVQAAEHDRLREQRPSALNTSQPPSTVPPPAIPPEELAPVADVTHAAAPPPTPAHPPHRKKPARRSAWKLPPHPPVPAHAMSPDDPRRRPADRAAARGADPDR